MINSNDVINISNTLKADEPLYCTREVSKILGLTRQTIANYARDGRIIPDADFGLHMGMYFTIDTITRLVLQVILHIDTRDMKLYNEVHEKTKEALQLIASRITKGSGA